MQARHIATVFWSHDRHASRDALCRLYSPAVCGYGLPK
jgi:hypothetical protein